MRYSFCLIFISSAIIGALASEEVAQIVQTKQGKVEGSLSENGLFYEFCGIRYGVAEKFQAPQEPQSYPGVYEANIRTVICPQFPTTDPLAAPSDIEDCLVLNVFTPANFLANTSLPVMVFLHGGDFGVGSGSPSFYGPQYLVSHGVVIVTINYRLNAYGFLNLGIKEAPGNAGLKDIRAALRWVQANIKSFGGDPENVTVMGQGSGGIAAIYLMFSESTKGLFHRIISQSGSLFAPHSFDAEPLATASQVAKSLGINNKKPKDLLKIYSGTSIKMVEDAISKQMHSKSVFRPSVETYLDEDPFLVDTPFNILSAGKTHKAFNPVPVLCGMSTVEGLTCTLEYNTITSQIDRIKNEDYSALDQRSLRVPKDEQEEVRKLLQETYFANGTSVDENVVGGMINMNTDFSFVGPMSLFAELFANSSGLPIYEYIFDYIGHRNLGRLLTNSSLPATTNQDELFYIFELERLPLPMDENDARMVTFMTMMWTNFAKFGSPTPDPANGEWLPYPHHLAILLEPAYVAPLTPDRAHFWRSFYYKYGVDCNQN
ncbi:hypothetical protein JYU34_008205 [Plutella xylostella]|uniref:Carboxylesterase type B domain-containing protein n=1 Tax=Plutella xylostella TaxID=51655 RepID=A0ABQ7QP26_PLUXY|nr:hypothetical protein JYU34_008205 [Plutella xylostella]